EGGDDEEEYDEEPRDEESVDPILQTPKNSDEEGNGEEHLGLNVDREEGHVKEEKEDELYRDVNINQGRGIQVTQEVEDSYVTLTPVNPDGQQQTNPFAEAVSAIPKIVHRYMDQQMNEAVKVAVQIQSDRLRDAIQRENDEFLRTIDETLKRSSRSRSKNKFRTMDTTIDQQVVRDEALVPHAKRLRIGRSNFRLLSDIKSKESTLQLVYDVLHLTLFFKAFLDEHKDTKKSNEMYYPRFTKVIIHHFMSKDPSIPRRNKVNWHYVRDNHMFSTIMLVSRHQNTQQFSALLPIELINKDIKNSNAYKECYAVATGVTLPKPKASARKTRSSSDTTITPPTAAAAMTEAQQLKLVTKRSLQQTHISQANGSYVDEGTGDEEGKDGDSDDDNNGDDGEEGDGDDDDEDDDGEEGDDDDDQKVERDDEKDDEEDEGSDDEQASDEEEFIHPSLSTPLEEETRDEESFDPIQKTPENNDDEGTKMMLIKTKNPLLDQTGGLRDTEKERSQIQQALHKKITTRSAGRPPLRWKSPHIQSLKQISKLAKQSDSHSSFNELMDTPVDFSNFLINRLKVDTLTPELLAGPTYELLKGSCKSLVELEYHLEAVYKATTYQLDWVNPEGQQYPHNLLKPLPLILNNQGPRVIPFHYFINNDLGYLHGGASSRKYTTSVTKTKAADYGHIKWIEDLVPRTMWVQEPIGYDKHALWGVSHWGRKCQQFYGFAVNREFARDVYYNIVIQRRVQDLQLGVESYQKKLNLTKPDTYHSDLKCKEAYIAYSNPKGFIYQNKDKKNRLMRIDELHKFSDGTLTNVRTALDDRLKGIRMQYLPQSIWRKSDKDRAAAMIQSIDKRLKTMRIMRSLERSLAEAYKSDKIILDTYRETFTLKRRHDGDVDKDEEPSTRLDRGSKRRREGKEPKSASALTETATRSVDRVYTLTPELLAGPTYELMKGSCKSLVELEYHLEEVYKAATDQLDRVNPEEACGRPSTRCQKLLEEAQPNKTGHNKDKRNRLTQIDELHKFSDGTLTDVHTALDDHLKGIRMQYLPTSIWRKSDNDRVAIMIQAIDKMLKTRRIMRSLEGFVGGRLYEGDFQMLQRTI
nr:hypothetical protein [Tanacetum cinerariifolium]